VTDGKNKSVSTDPAIIVWVMSHDFLKQEICRWCQTYCGSGVAIPNSLDCIRGKNPCGVDGQIVDFIPFQQRISPIKLCGLPLSDLRRRPPA
jgi:hypothetical protein